MKNKIEDLELLFAFLTTLIGVWLYMLFYILEVSKNEPANIDLFFLGMVHYYIFYFVIINLTLLAITGIENIPTNFLFKKVVGYKDSLKKALFTYWYPVLIIAVLGLVFNRIFSLLFKDIDDISVILVSIIGILHYWYIMKTRQSKLSAKGFFLLFTFHLSSFIYVMLMSIIFCDIEVETEQKIYSSKGKIHAIINRKGYIFNPNVKEIHFCFNPIKEDYIENNYVEFLSIDVKDYESSISFNGKNYISVIFKDQITGIRRTTYKPIYIKKDTLDL